MKRILKLINDYVNVLNEYNDECLKKYVLGGKNAISYMANVLEIENYITEQEKKLIEKMCK